MSLPEIQMRVSELSVPKQLSKEGIEELTNAIRSYVEHTGTNDLEVVLPFIINYVYNEAYLCAINDVLKIMRD